ncbi:MAG: methionine biosynthesis protein MetW, partial [Vicinamibacterales bacterium]
AVCRLRGRHWPAVMREGPLKRFLLAGLFSAREVAGAIRQATGPAGFRGQTIDYDGYWRERGAGGMHPRFAIIASGVRAGESVLDVGCGNGALLQHLKTTRQIRERGVDVSETGVALARAAGLDARVGLLGAPGTVEPAEMFDHVVLTEVIEHVADAEALLVQVWSHTRRTLWVTFPNIAYFPHRWRLAFGRFPIQWVLFPGEHLRFWSLPDFREWAVGAGLPEPSVLPSNGIVLGSLHRLWPNLFANQIVMRFDRPSA